ncbi:hypothetical protein TD3509T_60213 [Tenacibaculum dicentrarchi]|uniref:Uncharacterized protein n=1 Tax=Tenacibaculum dicentrarchi TaxID=669041 RepID=A0ABP1ELV1_9FLAO|nr:hypothetical protein TD3509T_60213 [Tenacibaculum dicentrarchi]
MQKLNLEKFTDNKLENLNAISGGGVQCEKTTYTNESAGCSGKDIRSCDGTYTEY